MALETPSNAIGRIDVNQLVSRAEPVVEPRATAALTSAFREGVITADDIVMRLGELGKTKKKAELTQAQEFISPEAQALRAQQTAAGTEQAQLAQMQAEQGQILQQYPAIAYFNKFAAEAGITAPTLPDGSPDYKQMEQIGAELAVYQAQKTNAAAKRNNIETDKSADGSILFARTKQGQLVDPKEVRQLDSLITEPFKRQQRGTFQVAPTTPVVEPQAATSAPTSPVVEARTTPPVEMAASAAPLGAPVGMGMSLGTKPEPPRAPKAPTEAQQRAQLAIARFAQAGDMQKALADAGYDPTSIGSWMNSMLPEVLKSGDRKQYDAAVDAWAQGLLRLESGAAITRQEKGWYERSFFPAVNDPPNVVAAKEDLRHSVETMAAEIAQQGGIVSPESAARTKRIYEQADAFATGKSQSTPATTLPKLSPEEARKLAPGTPFLTLDNRPKIR